MPVTNAIGQTVYEQKELRLRAITRIAAAFISIIVILSVGLWSQRYVPASTLEQHVIAKRAMPQVILSTESPPVFLNQYLPLTTEEAISINSVTSTEHSIGPSASPFHVTGSEKNIALARKCLTDAIYYEAASEGIDGQRAVAQVVLNRVRSPAYPATVCGVVYQGAERKTGCQFTFTCDGSLMRPVSNYAWARAQRVALAALDGFVFPPVGYATHYHANWVVPYWASSLTRSNSVGAHIFYRWNKAWGRPQAFSQRYAGTEQEPPVQLYAYNEAKGPEADSLGDNTRSNPGLTEPIMNPSLGRAPVLKADTAVRSSLLADDNPATLIPSLSERIKPKVDRTQ